MFAGDAGMLRLAASGLGWQAYGPGAPGWLDSIGALLGSYGAS
jgi:hypothetical protein